MNKRNTAILLLILVMQCITCGISFAQRTIYVTGTLKDKESHQPFDLTYNPEVWAFNTLYAAEQTLIGLQADAYGTHFETDGIYPVDESGYYEIGEGVSEDGALIFKVDGGTPELIKINGRKKISAEIMGAKSLENVEILQNVPNVPVPIPAIATDEWLRMENIIPVPHNMGRRNLRMIYQPFLLDMKTNDTVEWCKAMVTDGLEYSATQNRRMGYDIRHDQLYPFITGKQLREGLTLNWKDSVMMPDPANGKYQVHAFIAFEDYSSIVYQNQAIIINGIRRPFRHIDYNCALLDIDAAKYPRRPRREARSAAHNMHLTFMVGSSELDSSNPSNAEEIEKLEATLLNILSTRGASIQEIRFTGVSSPEGNYEANIALAHQRNATVRRRALSIMPQAIANRIYSPEEAMVASWEEVIPIIEPEYPALAAQVREICASTTNHNQRTAQIMRLPEYGTVITGTFPQLRRVTCEFKFDVFRAPSDEEILEEYNSNPNLRTGKEKVSLYEYGRLFELLKGKVDTRDMETLYRSALEASKEARNPWCLPANLLACSYMRRDTTDLEILRPFINFNSKLNMANGQNIEQLVSNQMIMYLKAFRTDSAMVLRDKLPDGNFALQKALSSIRDYTNPKVFNAISFSNDINYVVMHLAQNYNDKAETKIETLDKNDALTWYLRAVLNCRKGFDGEEEAAEDLVRCWELDWSFHENADNDGDLSFSAVAFAEQLWKEKQEEKDNSIETNNE